MDRRSVQSGLYVTNCFGRIIRIDPTTGAQEVFASGGYFTFPRGLAPSADGGWFVANYNGPGGSLIRVDPAGSQTLVTGLDPLAVPTDPMGVALDADGNVLITDWANGRVIRVDPATGAQTSLGSGMSFASGLAIVPSDAAASGRVAGGGWLESAPGAYADNPSAAGRATLGFVARVRDGAAGPEGNVEFQFKLVDLNFHSTNFTSLTVNADGTRAKLMGSGTINGFDAPVGQAYRFTIWANDGAPDTFRIKIWLQMNDVTETIYDNGPGQAIARGSIVIDKK